VHLQDQYKANVISVVSSKYGGIYEKVHKIVPIMKSFISFQVHVYSSYLICYKDSDTNLVLLIFSLKSRGKVKPFITLQIVTQDWIIHLMVVKILEREKTVLEVVY